MSDRAYRVLLAASDTDTVSTRVFDIAQQYPWPATIPERVLRNEFTNRWHGHEEELTVDRRAHDELAAAIVADDHRLAPINAGQGVAALRVVRPAAEVIGQLCTEAYLLLDRHGTS